jgi:tRNA dimethylallyltransferase
VAEPPVLALVGPTGAGKSALALEVAERVDVEIVAVDAFTVYRGMDVGTAKPSRHDRARVRHHLVDVLAPAQLCTVQWFQQTARAAIDDVRGRDRVPLLVGGSGLYFRAVVDDLRFPPTDPAVRRAVEARYGGDAAAAWRALHTVDPPAAARIDPGNLRRTVRALEVVALTQRPFSEWRRAWHDHVSVYGDLRVVGVALDRPALARRIDARVEGMVAAGLLDECRRLLATGPLSTTARQAIGYAEMIDHLAGQVTFDEAVAATKQRTRRYAARQQRWFQADPRLRWAVPAEVPEVLAP